MNRFFTKTFARFFFGFLAILIVALGIMIGAGYYTQRASQTIDTPALSQ